MLRWWKSIILLIAVFIVGIKMVKEIRVMLIPSGAIQAQSGRVYDVAVIGSGAAGSMAAYRAVLNNDVTLFAIGNDDARRHSRGTWVTKLSNTPIYEDQSRSLLSFRNDAIRSIVKGPQKDKFALLEDSIVSLRQNSNGSFTLRDSENTPYHAKYVILATGIMDEQPHIAGSIDPIFPYANEQQVIYCSRCDAHLSADKEAVTVIGSSSGAAQNAILLHERYGIPQLSILTNGQEPQWSKQEMKQLKAYNIKHYKSAIISISSLLGGSLEHFELADHTQVPAQLALVCLGIRPNNELASQLGADLDSRGLVKADVKGLTSVPGLYVAGDLRAGIRKQFYVAWDSAVRAAEAINRKLRAERRVNS